MIKVEIKNKQTQEITHMAQFPTQAEADAWIARQVAKGDKCAWGRPASSRMQIIVDENSIAILDENGEQQWEEVVTEAEFDIVITDITNATNWANLRSKRDRLLAECDWTQVADCALSETKKIQWKTYRTSLRDLPANTADPANPVWPSKPQ